MLLVELHPFFCSCLGFSCLCSLGRIQLGPKEVAEGDLNALAWTDIIALGVATAMTAFLIVPTLPPFIF